VVSREASGSLREYNQNSLRESNQNSLHEYSQTSCSQNKVNEHQSVVVIICASYFGVLVPFSTDSSPVLSQVCRVQDSVLEMCHY
jgi:hypothetical protein